MLCTDPASKNRAKGAGNYTVETSYASNDVIPVKQRRRPFFNNPSETYMLGHATAIENDPRIFQSMMTGGSPPGAWWPGYHGIRLQGSPALIAGTCGFLMCDGSVLYLTLLEALALPQYWTP
jgi:hypothetical protein